MQAYAAVPEVLAPAGSRQALEAAVRAGADAVYLGLTDFNARRTAGNFDAAALQEAAAFCRARGVKCYLAFNTELLDGELPRAEQALRAARGRWGGRRDCAGPCSSRPCAALRAWRRAARLHPDERAQPGGYPPACGAWLFTGNSGA